MLQKTPWPDLPAPPARRSLFEHAVESVQACVDAGEIRGDARRITHAFWSGLHGLMTLHVNGQLVHGCDLDELAPALLDLLRSALAPSSAVSAESTRKPNRNSRRCA